MSFSVNTNTAAMVALQNLNATGRMLEQTQLRISTGLEVASAKDNGAVYAIAQNMRGDIGALGAVQQSVNRAMSITDVALAAGETISDLLVEMKAKAVAAADSSIDTASRTALDEDFRAMIDQIRTIIASAEFDGANLLNGSLVSGIAVLADADAQNSITVGAESLSLGGAILTFASTLSLSSLTASQSAIAEVQASLTNINAALARLGSVSKKLETHFNFVGKLTDALRGGIGNLVDADLADESARLQALQVKQQLGVQALSIANSNPQIILSLFRN